MWKPASDLWATLAVWSILLLGAFDRAHLLSVFGLNYIGIDDALIQQVAIDYGHGIFREPFLYGQNYNPMLEALLAAPFIRLGAAPWVALPLVTSLLALLPFWSFSLWCLRKKHASSAIAVALVPLLLPTEWGLITSLPRGFVHGLVWLSALPWLQGIRRPFLKHFLSALALVCALLCNPNASPLVAGIGLYLMLTNARSWWFWITGGVATSLGVVAYLSAQAFFHELPPVHPLTEADVHWSIDLLQQALQAPAVHFLNMTPLNVPIGWVALFVLLSTIALWRQGDRASAGILFAAAIMVFALGVLKVHQGCESVFFPRSRMFLALPLLLAIIAALLLKGSTPPKWTIAPVLLLSVLLATAHNAALKGTIGQEMAMQGCGYVREEPIEDVALRCLLIKDVALREHADVVVPIRWPGIDVDHRAHFQAHFTCYACEQLIKGFPSTFGAGYDRRYWVRNTHEFNAQGRVLFVGGDPNVWRNALLNGLVVDDRSTWGIQLHLAQCDTVGIVDLITRMGVDDDLGR
ncbi:MAG TPA: hypothetical protein PK760_01725 [Flavobacteriales bacterium]|nr:hypothetical protein [Flavobacteriales bacterium]